MKKKNISRFSFIITFHFIIKSNWQICTRYKQQFIWCLTYDYIEGKGVVSSTVLVFVKRVKRVWQVSFFPNSGT